MYVRFVSFQEILLCTRETILDLENDFKYLYFFFADVPEIRYIK